MDQYNQMVLSNWLHRVDALIAKKQAQVAKINREIELLTELRRRSAAANTPVLTVVESETTLHPPTQAI